MTVLHAGSTKKFSSGWETIFGGGAKTSKKKAAKPTLKAKATKPSTKKASSKKKSAGKKAKK